MHCLADSDVSRFAERVLPHLRQDPVRNSVACTLVESRASGLAQPEPGALWLRVMDGEALAAVALQTPPHPLLLTGGPAPAIDLIADHVLTMRPELEMVSGPAELSARFAERWSAATGQAATVVMRQRLFRLDKVTPPAAVQGALRAAVTEDRELLVGWYDAFRTEAMPDQPAADSAPLVDRALARGDALWLWEVDGVPVSLVGAAPPVGGVVRIAPVFTPPPLRGRGYASASVAAVSQRALDHGADACMLYTDLANPTSNRIYQAIGYYPVSDATQWRLRAQ